MFIYYKMPKDKLRSYFLLHLIVFIWGFTAILGKLISIDALPLVWYRMGIASLLILAYVRFCADDLEAARAEAHRALQLNPNSLYILDGIAYLMTWHWPS